MLGSEQLTARQAFDKYKDDMQKLIAYLPWLEATSGRARVSSIYTGDNLVSNTMTFPVYDGNLLRFVKDAENTAFVDRNYVYVINANRLKTTIDEKKFVCAQGMIQVDKIGAVLAKYVLGGKIKGRLWSQAVDEGIFLEIVTRLKELYDEGVNY